MTNQISKRDYRQSPLLSLTGLGILVGSGLILFCPLIALADCPVSGTCLQEATASFSQTSFEIGEAIDGDHNTGNGWAILDPSQQGDETLTQDAVFETVADIEDPDRLMFTMHLGLGTPGSTLGRFRLYVTDDVRSEFADGLSTGGDVTANWTLFVPDYLAATNGVILTWVPAPAPGGRAGADWIIHCAALTLSSVYKIGGDSPLSTITGIRLEVIDDDEDLDQELPTGGPGVASDGNFGLIEIAITETGPVPAVSEWGLVVLILLVLGAGTLVFRRRAALAG